MNANSKKDGDKETKEDNEETDKILSESQWIAESLQFDGYTMAGKKPMNGAPNWRVNEVFQFMATRIRDADTTLDVRWLILQWFAAVVVKFDAVDLRLYDYYVITVIVYMLKDLPDPNLKIEMTKQIMEIDRQEFEGMTPAQMHKVELYKKCIEMSNDIMRELKAKIGDTQFVEKYERLSAHNSWITKRSYFQDYGVSQ